MLGNTMHKKIEIFIAYFTILSYFRHILNIVIITSQFTFDFQFHCLCKELAPMLIFTKK